VRQRSALELGDALLHHGVPAVLPLDVEERLVPVGEHRVVPPHRDGQGLLVQRLPGAGERGVDGLSDLSAAGSEQPVIVLHRVPVGDRRTARTPV